MPKINVKCGSKLLAVDVDLEEPPMVLKAQLYCLTEIPPERQRLLIRGKTIGDESWNGIMLKDGATIMLVGGTAPITTTPSDTTVNLAKANTGSPEKGVNKSKTSSEPVVLPAGLINLGNSCYMNATLQCFKVIPELTASLKRYMSLGGRRNEGGDDASLRPSLMARMLKQLYADMDSRVAQELVIAEDMTESEQTATTNPIIFFHILHQTFPQFATQDERGNYQQQDANECFCEVLRLLTDELKVFDVGNENSEKEGGGGVAISTSATIPLKKFFEIEYQVTTKCLEEGSAEEVQMSTENGYQASCYLSTAVRYLQSGIKSKLVEEIEKLSETLGRNARYEKSSLVSRLPAYFSVQIVRFFYKEKEKINAKILKDVKFPMVLDVFDICAPELKEKLKPAREALKDYDDTRLELLRKAKLAPEDAPEAKPDLTPKSFHPNTFSDDPGSNNSGVYELKALITHKGRASNSGHYVAWIRVGDDDEEEGAKRKFGSGIGGGGGGNNSSEAVGNSKWVACDDDNIYPVSEKAILDLSGGGDWHCAYVLLYGPKKIPII